jgi:hypothetical protein
MSRSSTRRGQTEPLVAIVAVFAVVVGLVAYAGVFESILPGPPQQEIAIPTLGRAYATFAPAGVVDPKQLTRERLVPVGPDGYQVNVTVIGPRTEWHAGPPVPREVGQSAGGIRKPSVDRATRPVSVRRGPGVVRPGMLQVAVWQ